MLQKKRESEEREERREIREKLKWREGRKERKNPTQAGHHHISEDKPGRPITIYL